MSNSATDVEAYLADWPLRTTIQLTGAERAVFLHNLCTNEVKALQPGETTEAFITNVQGRTIGHVLIACRTDDLLLTTVPGQAAVLMQHLDRYLIAEDVALKDVSGLQQLLVFGGRAACLLSEITASDQLDGVHQLTSGEADFTIWKMPYIAGDCFALLGQPDTIRPVYDAALAAGGVASSAAVLEPLRIVHKFPWFGVDLSDQNFPQELDRDRLAISFQKGCYLGQETVARIDAVGHVNKMLVRFAGNGRLEAGAAVTAQQQAVGHVTSWAATASGFVGLGYLRSGNLEPGTKLRSGDVDVEVIG